MAQKASGSLTITNITDGANANIWTTSTAPTTPNYTFTISNLTGADDNPRVGDIILQGVYRYTITSIGSTTVLAGSRQSLQGATGAAGGKWYSGTGITGTNTTAQVFSGSGVSSAVVGDMYLNTSTDNVYQCTTAGNASTAKWKYVGNIKGSTGNQGRSVTSVVTEYYRKLSGGSAPTSSTTGSTTRPDYVDGCTYYTRTITNFDSGSPDKSEWTIDTGLTNEVKNAYDAWIAAGAAELKVAKIIQNSEGMIVTSGINGGDVTPGTASTYGYNTLMAPNYLGLRYNAINLAKLTTTESTPALEFYIPSVNSGGTPIQGNKGLSISATALTFYNPSSNAAQLIIGANGVLQSGNYVYTSGTYSDSGTKIDLTNGSIYTPGFRTNGSNTYIRGEINALSGKIGNNSTNYWTIGNNYNYDQTASAALISHGTAFIQLDTSNTWRLSTDRIHTAWNGTDSSAALMFPKDGNTYWDWGIHSPHQTNNVWKDKFVYARKYTNTTDDDFTNRDNLSNDIDDDLGFWKYQFYIDKNGSIYARNFYLLNEDGTPGSNIGGQDSVYLLKSGGTITGNLEVNGNLTKGSKTVTYLTATPTSGQILIADGTSGGIKTSGYTIAKSVPSNALFTDENVKSTEANTTKLWLVGSDTSGTRTGTLKYDSGVYITTTAGTLHATTFDGTATRATADSDGNTIKTTYLKLSGGNVTGAVTFGSSISAASASIVDLTVTGNASFTNNISANTINGVTVGSTPRFTDSMVTQTATTTSAAYEVLFSYTADNTTRTESARKTSTLTYNPSTKELTVGTVKIKEASTGFTISGGTTSKTLTVGGDYTLAAAAAKGVVTTVDTSANLPTSNAVKTFVEGKNYITANHTSTYSLPLAASGTRGGVQIGYTQSGKNYPVQLSSEKMYVNVPWENTTYTIATGTSNGKIKITPSSGSAYEISVYGWTDWLPLTGGQVTGPVNFGDSVSIDDVTVGQLIVNGNASFVNGLTTTTVNGYAPAAAMAKGVVTSIDTSANLPTSNAVKTFVENKGYVTSSGVTSVTVAATSPVQSSTGTAQTGSSVSTTISLKDGYGDTKNPYASKTANYVLAAPNGSNGVPSFRALVAADIPNLNWSKITAGKPTTASGYGITDALVGATAESVSGGSTTFTFTKSNGDPLSFDVVVYASAATQATDANYLTDGTSRYSTGGTKNPIYFENGIPKASNGTEGTSTKPVYLSSGTLTAGSTYAGGTAVTLNGSGKGASTASFYAPTSAGTTSQVLIGGGSAPSWKNISELIPSSATNATNDSDGNQINTTYLKKSGGTMTGAITFVGGQSSAWNDKGILFTKGSRIGENSSGGLGVYAVERIYLRPNSATASSGDGVEISTDGLYPSNNNTESLGTSSNKWANVYATTFNGALSGNATSATKANLTTTANAVAYYTDTAGTFGSKASANGALYATSANGALTFGTLPIAQGGTGATNKRAAGLIYDWTAVIQGQKWSRICYVPVSTTTVGSNFFLNVRGTRGSVVYNYTFNITTNHDGNDHCDITALSGSQYSALKIRGVTGSGGDCYIELYDDANGIASGTTQNVYCHLYILTKGTTEPTLYTAFTDGTTIPSNYKTKELNLVNSGGIQLTGKLYGNVSGTATKALQDGDGNVIKTTYLKLTGGNVTGATTFGSSVSINSLSVVDMTCTGSASFTNGLSGNLTGNASTATAFSSNASITLTGDTTGTASSTKGWTIATTTKKLSQTTTSALSSFTDTTALIYTAYGGNNAITDKPASVDAFGCLSFKTADGWYGQLLMSSNAATGLYWRTATTLSGGWKKLLDSTNYTDYTVTKTGSGATGTWDISISGSAATLSTTAVLTSSHNENSYTGTNVIKLYGHSNNNRPSNCPEASYNSGLLVLPSGRGIDTFQLEYSCNTGDLYTRSWLSSSTPSSWKTLINSSNYTSYTVTKTGTGASGTWDISISGTAAKATADKNGNDITTKYVTIDTEQTITASQKTFTGATRWGSASKYGATYYDSTLEALVFSFA